MSPPAIHTAWATDPVNLNGYSEAVETLIFVDIDGVLNIGIQDPNGAPLQFNEPNAEQAMERYKTREDLFPSHHLCVDRLVAACSREVGNGEDGLYARFLSPRDTSVSDIFVARLAELVEVAGPRCEVVLSSTWRWPRHKARVKEVEAQVSKHLGRPFTFEHRTPLREDRTPALRLQCISDFVATYCEESLIPGDRLRVLVLEDFHVSPLGSWHCGREQMNSCAAVEQYLLSQMPSYISGSARLVHTYDEWTTPDGLRMQLGCGLTQRHLRAALDFLRGPLGACHQAMQCGEKLRACVSPRTTELLRMSDALLQAMLRAIPCVG
jgi:hypothetical protein